MAIVEFKTGRIRSEFDSLMLAKRNPAMLAVMLFTDYVSQVLTNQGVLITEIYRTHQEQENICEAIGKPFYNSVHQYWRGFDLSVARYDPSDVPYIVDFVNGVFDYGRGFAVLSAKPHGTAPHIHGQVPSAAMPWEMKRG